MSARPEMTLDVASSVATSEPPQPPSRVAPAPPTPLVKLAGRLPNLISETGHSEMWGVQLSGLEHVPTKVVLQKFLRANNDDVGGAAIQLSDALEWRKKMNPTALVDQTFDRKKFADLGFVTVHEDSIGLQTIITWNIYGAVKNNKATFGDVEEFIKWRAAIMELSVQKLKLDQVTEPIPEGGPDPYQMIQVHDYQNVAFFRMDPAVKAASKKTIQVFSMAYPELLAHKYFVNVPAIMGWMFGMMKLVLTPATLKKFHPMSSGTTLATELTRIASSLPKEYGGKGPSVKEGLTLAFTDPIDTSKELPPAPESETDVEETAHPVVATTVKVLPVRVEKPAEGAKPVSSLKPITEDADAAEQEKPVVAGEAKGTEQEKSTVTDEVNAAEPAVAKTNPLAATTEADSKDIAASAETAETEKKAA